MVRLQVWTCCCMFSLQQRWKVCLAGETASDHFEVIAQEEIQSNESRHQQPATQAAVTPAAHTVKPKIMTFFVHIEFDDAGAAACACASPCSMRNGYTCRRCAPRGCILLARPGEACAHGVILQHCAARIPVDDLATLQQHQRRNALYAEALRCCRPFLPLCERQRQPWHGCMILLHATSCQGLPTLHACT